MVLEETIAIRTPAGVTVPLIERGTPLPVSKEEVLSTTRDGQEQLHCELVTVNGTAIRSAGHMEVGLAHAPRGVPKVTLRIRVDSRGSVQAELTAPHGMASSSFSVATR